MNEMHRYESEKSFYSSPFLSIKHSTYFSVYDELFSPFRGRDITFVEIGVLHGGSLFMWRDFFGPSARIIGVDSNPESKKWEEFGFEIYVGDQASPEFWKSFKAQVGKIDVLLDDGGHTYLQQIVTLDQACENMNDGGLIVIEDTHTSYLGGFGSKKYSFINYAMGLVHRNNFRYESLQHLGASTKTWSIQFFESIVSFHFDQTKVGIRSLPVQNFKPGDDATDQRYANNKKILLMNKLSRVMKLDRIPGWSMLKLFTVNLIRKFDGSKRSLRKYFQSIGGV